MDDRRVGDVPVSDSQHAAIQEMFLGKRGRIKTYLFEIAAGVAYPLAGLSYVMNPDNVAAHSAITHRIYPFDYIWSFGYILGGVLVLAGVILPRLRLRAIGLLLLGAALTMQVIAAVSTHPELREAFNAVYAVACFVRAWLIVKLFDRYKTVAAVGERV